MKRLALLIALACSFCASAREPLRIHPIGDSITQGGSTSKGGPELTYRYPLQQALAGLGIAFDFVGGNRKGLDASPWPASFDPDHDGYYGRTTAQVRDLMAPIPSDVAIIDLGTNDANQWNVWRYIVDPMATIIVRLRAANPRVAVFIAEPSFGDSSRGWLRRTALQQLARDLSTRQSPVIFVPAPASWDPAADTFDGVHPNARGSTKLAAGFIAAMLNSSIGLR